MFSKVNSRGALSGRYFIYIGESPLQLFGPAPDGNLDLPLSNKDVLEVGGVAAPPGVPKALSTGKRVL